PSGRLTYDHGALLGPSRPCTDPGSCAETCQSSEMPCSLTVMISPELHATRQVSPDTAVSVPPEKAWLASGVSTVSALPATCSVIGLPTSKITAVSPNWAASPVVQLAVPCWPSVWIWTCQDVPPPLPRTARNPPTAWKS